MPPKKSTIPKLSEFQIETQILDYLNAIPGCFAFKIDKDGYFDVKRGFYRKRKSKYSIPGVSDIIGIYQGKALFFEVKARYGVVSEEQKAFLMKTIALGAIAGVVKSVEDVMALLQKK